MSKGLPRSLSRGAPQRQEIVKQIFTVRDGEIVMAAASGDGVGSLVIGDFPEGNILFLGAVGYFAFAGSGADDDLAADWEGSYGIGTTPAGDATISTTDEDITTEADIAAASAEVSARTRSAGATQAIFDNTDGSLEINLNLLIDDVDIAGADSVITVNGELAILYSVLMDD
jgi:hypothetical protein